MVSCQGTRSQSAAMCVPTAVRPPATTSLYSRLVSSCLHVWTMSRICEQLCHWLGATTSTSGHTSATRLVLLGVCLLSQASLAGVKRTSMMGFADEYSHEE